MRWFEWVRNPAALSLTVRQVRGNPRHGGRWVAGQEVGRNIIQIFREEAVAQMELATMYAFSRGNAERAAITQSSFREPEWMEPPRVTLANASRGRAIAAD
jgi:hypothetical protein